MVAVASENPGTSSWRLEVQVGGGSSGNHHSAGGQEIHLQLVLHKELMVDRMQSRFNLYRWRWWCEQVAGTMQSNVRWSRWSRSNINYRFISSYAGGGGGGGSTSLTGWAGGLEVVAGGAWSMCTAGHGTANTGGGGGGAGIIHHSVSGGNGGSGVVVIRYKFQ